MLGDGEHINNVVRTGSMDDVGTRLKFLTELYELWGTGIDILDRYDRHKPDYDAERQKLMNARDMLYFHMTKDYNENNSFKGEDPPNSNLGGNNAHLFIGRTATDYRSYTCHTKTRKHGQDFSGNIEGFTR